jgi:hypothetical protein
VLAHQKPSVRARRRWHESRTGERSGEVIMTRYMRWSLLGAALGAVLSVEAGAHGVPRSARDLLRCQQAITREGLEYSRRLNLRMTRCLLPLGDCAASNASSCNRSAAGCTTLAADMNALEGRMRNDVVRACREVPVDQILGTLGFGPGMADCTVNSLDAFAACLARKLREAEASALTRVVPSVCELADRFGIGTVVAPAVCEGDDPGDPPAPPAGALFCGGPDAVACPDGYACDRRDALCTLGDGAGECVSIAETCAPGSPVCGCDGQTYASDCDRVRAGVVRRHDGACEGAPVVCGVGRPACPSGTFCEFPRGDCGEGGVGTCMPLRAEACDLCVAFVGGPVCSCNGQTYANECARQRAGASKWFDGECFF